MSDLERNFTRGSNEQKQHFTELIQKVSTYVQKSVLLRDLPRLDGNHKHFVTTKRKQALVRQTIVPLQKEGQGLMLTVDRWPQASKNSRKWLWGSKKDLNWSYRTSKHLGTFLLLKISPQNVPIPQMFLK